MQPGMCIGKVSRRVSHTPYRPQKVAVLVPVPVPVPVLPYCATMMHVSPLTLFPSLTFLAFNSHTQQHNTCWGNTIHVAHHLLRSLGPASVAFLLSLPYPHLERGVHLTHQAMEHHERLEGHDPAGLIIEARGELMHCVRDLRARRGPAASHLQGGDVLLFWRLRVLHRGLNDSHVDDHAIVAANFAHHHIHSIVQVAPQVLSPGCVG